jgi:hypothetical protein
MNPDSRFSAAHLRIFQALAYALVFLMMACVTMTVASLIRNAFPAWASGAMAGITLLVIVDRLIMHARMKRLEPYGFDWFLTLGTQWIVIVTFSRLLLSYAHRDALPSSSSDLITVEFLATVALAALVWDWAGQFLGLLDVIGLDQVQALANREATSGKDKEYVPVHQRLVNLTFGLGIVVVILTALARLDLGGMLNGVSWSPRAESSQFTGAEAGALLYFLFGLGLISLSRLLALQTQWRQQRIPVVSGDLQRQWGVYALSFILLLAAIVSLLPSGDSWGFFAVLASLIAFLLGALFFIAQLLMLLLMLLINVPNFLLGRPLTWLNPFPLQPAQPLPPVETGAPIPGSEMLEFLRSVLLWGSLAAIVIFSIKQFIRQHEGLAARLRRSRIAQLIMLAWQWLRGNVEAVRGNLARAVLDGWKNLRIRFEGRLESRPGWISLRSLDPRRQIYFYYLAMIRRAQEGGLERKAAQTPTEYAAHLQSTLPAAHKEISSLTNGFMEARYSDHPLTSDDSNRVKAAWGRLRRALGSLVITRKA